MKTAQQTMYRSLDPDQSTGGVEFKTRTLPDVKKHILRNYGVVDLGKHPVSFEGRPSLDKEGKQIYQSQVALLFEFPKVLEAFKEGEEPTPYTIAQDYTFIASDRSKICKVLKAWGGLKENPKKLNLRPYLGKYCEANITHSVSKKDSSKIYANIGDGGRDVFPVTKEFVNPADGKTYKLVDDNRIPIGCKSHNADIWFDLDNFSWDQFKTIPKYVQDKIRKCVEFPAILYKFPEPASATAQHASYANDSVVNNSATPVESLGDDVAPVF